MLDLALEPVLPPQWHKLNKLEYDRELYKRRNEVERLFRRLTAFRRIFSRVEKLDGMFIAFIHFALIVEGLFQKHTLVHENQQYKLNILAQNTLKTPVI